LFIQKKESSPDNVYKVYIEQVPFSIKNELVEVAMTESFKCHHLPIPKFKLVEVAASESAKNSLHNSNYRKIVFYFYNKPGERGRVAKI
jgi:hypothetical protein